MSTTSRVIVVGAGVSGLTAARRLEEAGVEVVVIEARDRVGGRTLTRTIAGGTFDLGGQWLGPDQHRMHALVDELGLGTFDTWHTGTKVLDLRGNTSTYSGDLPSLPPLQLLELHLVLRRVERAARRVPADAPWAASEAERLDALTVETLKQRWVRSRRVRALLDAAVRVVWGCEPRELSALHFLMYASSAGGFERLIEIDGGAQQTRLSDGMQTLALRLADTLDGEIVLDAPIERIEQGDGVTVWSGSRSWRGERVILAVPPLLAGRISYDPPLPANKEQYLQRVPMGNTLKALAIYDTPFWREAGYSGEVVYDGSISVCFDNTTHDGVPALLCFVVGQAARDWAAWSPERRRDRVVHHLTRWFGPAARQLRHYEDHVWSSEGWTGGCPVGFHAPGVLSTAGRVLRDPVGRIHFAGTETARAWTGFLEGAIESGERAAAEVLHA